MTTSIGPLYPGAILRLVLLRHGEPVAEARGRCYGKLDLGLSDVGRLQIEHKLPMVSSFCPDVIYSSPRKRAMESAQVVASSLGKDLKMGPALCEIDFGKFEGETYENIERLYPAEFMTWMEQPTKMKFPGGESFSEMKERVLGFVAGLRSSYRGQTVLLVSHGGTNRTILADALGIPDENIFRIDQPHACVNVVDYFETYAMVLMVNA